MEQRDDLAKAIGIERLLLKREDMTPTGSFKYRSALRQMEALVERGKEEGVISSSGNAAISLAHEAKAQGVRLFAFVSPDMVPAKLEALLAYDAVVIVSRRAPRLANYLSAGHRLPNLRPSVDDHAVVGFVPLGEEIEEQMEPHGGAGTIVSFMTSGASMLGMTKGYRAEPRPRFVAVRSSDVGRFGITKSPREVDVASVAELVRVEPADVESARGLLSEYGLSVAEEATAAFAWIMKERPRGNVVWVVSGRAWGAGGQGPEAGIGGVPVPRYAETFDEVDRIYAEAHV